MLSVSVKSEVPKVKEEIVDATYTQEQRQGKLSGMDVRRWGLACLGAPSLSPPGGFPWLFELVSE